MILPNSPKSYHGPCLFHIIYNRKSVNMTKETEDKGTIIQCKRIFTDLKIVRCTSTLLFYDVETTTLNTKRHAT